MICDLLKAARLNSGMTLKQVAGVLGVREGNVSRWENGHTTPNAGNFVTLALMYSGSVDAFLRGEFL